MDVLILFVLLFQYVVLVRPRFGTRFGCSGRKYLFGLGSQFSFIRGKMIRFIILREKHVF
jgi:hypothetical protein